MLVAAALEVIGIGMIPAFVAIVADPETVMSIELLQPVLNLLYITTAKDLLLWGSAALVTIFILKIFHLAPYNLITKPS